MAVMVTAPSPPSKVASQKQQGHEGVRHSGTKRTGLQKDASDGKDEVVEGNTVMGAELEARRASPEWGTPVVLAMALMDENGLAEAWKGCINACLLCLTKFSVVSFV